MLGNETFQLRVKRLTSSGIVPTWAHAGDSGLDLYASKSHVIEPGTVVSVGTGIALELPVGTEGQVRPRSGLAGKHGVTVLNSPGTIDEGYRGEIRVILVNHGKVAFRVGAGSRIAQLVVQRRIRVEVVEVYDVSDTSRGEDGFGSSGV